MWLKKTVAITLIIFAVVMTGFIFWALISV